MTTDPAAEALLPCPFCGGQPQRNTSSFDGSRIVFCCGCNAEIRAHGDAAAQWNTRSQAPAPADAVTDEMVYAGAVSMLDDLTMPLNRMHGNPVIPTPHDSLMVHGIVRRCLEAALRARAGAQ